MIGGNEILLKLSYKIKSEDLNSSKCSDIEKILDEKFGFDSFTYDENEFDDYANFIIDIINKKCQEDEKFFLYYIRDALERGGNINQMGRIMLHHIWPLFFSKFPSGQIWMMEIDQKWQDEIWFGQRTLAIESGYLEKNPGLYSPQEMSGLDSYNFPYNSFNILSYGIYPLITTIHYQMTEESTLYTRILWDMHHIFDDQWTFDSDRGPKNSVHPFHIIPTEQLEYYEWFIRLINGCMEHIISIGDFLKREQLVLTLNRSIFDAQLSTVTELPYVAKIFFFNFVDKIANIMALLNDNTNDAQLFEKMFDEDFVKKDILSVIEKIPNKSGDFFKEILNRVIDELIRAEISPDDLRYIRNTNHGYNLLKNNTKRIMGMDGELDNDITLLASPFILYILYQISNLQLNDD